MDKALGFGVGGFLTPLRERPRPRSPHKLLPEVAGATNDREHWSSVRSNRHRASLCTINGDRPSQWRSLGRPLGHSPLASLHWFLEPLAPLDEHLQEASQPLADLIIHEF